MATETHFMQSNIEHCRIINDLSDATTELITKILQHKQKPLDKSALSSISENVCNEIEHFGLALLRLVKKIRESVLADVSEQFAQYHTTSNLSNVGQVKNYCESKTSEYARVKDNQCAVDIELLKQTLELEQNNTDELQHSINDLRVTQEERMVKLEQQVLEGQDIKFN